MAETTTANFGWTMPDPGASANTWGATLNATTQKVDAQVFANQQAGVNGSVPVGAGALWFTLTPPANWLIANGASLATTGTYAALFALFGYTYGGSGANFNLPNLTSRFPMGAGSLATVGGEATHLLTAAELAAHAHPITDVAHNHVVNQSPHAHGDPGHAHGVNDPGHAHGGVVRQMSGWFSLAAQNPQIEGGQVTDAAGTGISIQGAVTGLQAANANISLNPSGTGLSTTQNAGGGAAHNNLPPYLTVNFIIKYQ